MVDVLYAPDRECAITTNAWAFLHWLRTVLGVVLADGPALQRWSAEQPSDFRAAVKAFARLPDATLRLAERPGTRAALAARRADGSRMEISGDELRQAASGASGWPSELTAPLSRSWPTALLVRPLADVLLHADIRPDDRLLIIGPAWPWLVALLEGAAVVVAAAADPFATAANERTTVLVAPAQGLAQAAFRRPRRRVDLASLRTIVATGGPLSPEGRRRIYTWVKSDVMLLARTGDTFWGNPLEPVLAHPPATPAFLTPQPSGQAIR
jgi:hypothetical protein